MSKLIKGFILLALVFKIKIIILSKKLLYAIDLFINSISNKVNILTTILTKYNKGGFIP